MRTSKFDSITVRAWIEQYKEGHSLAEIAEAHDTYPSTVWRQLRARGVVMRKAQRRRAPSVRTVAKVAASGLDQGDVADVLGTSRPTVSRRLKEARG